jgi:hypothetical protein
MSEATELNYSLIPNENQERILDAAVFLQSLPFVYT